MEFQEAVTRQRIPRTIRKGAGTLMKDPVIVSSGHTFERACVQACNTLGFIPTLMDGTVPDFSTVIPNLALKSTILKWCTDYSLDPPNDKTTLNFFSAEKLVHAKNIGNPTAEAETPQEERRSRRCPLVFEIEEGLISLRNTTRAREDDTRLQLCTSRLLSVLKPLIISRYTNIQVNSVACLVNLSLEKINKIKIVRSGILPLLIDVLKGGFPEAREHACGAIFSLALDDRNKIAIGVLGALSPLLHLLRSDERHRTRHDSGLALYHLSLVQSNVTKLVKLGSVPILLDIVKSGRLGRWVLLILCNLALCPEGRDAMRDSGGVDFFVGLLKRRDLKYESAQEICVSVLYGLSHGGLRFKGLARAAGAVEVLMQVENTGNDRTKKMVKRIIKILTETRMEEVLEDSGSTRCVSVVKKMGLAQIHKF
ncbi:hypothetical protein OIU78_025963 [Salix suchowensis]|nr:hypothetical protein OIU78_025963 [Salix suchowensis]